MAQAFIFAGGAFTTIEDEDGDGRLVVGVDDPVIFHKTPSESLRLRIDFEDELSEGVTLASVAATIPEALEGSGESTDTDAGTWDIDIDDGVHAALYVLQFVGTLSNGSTVVRNWPIRVFNG